MKIIHYKKTNIAEAPDELCRAITRYTNHDSYVVKNGNMSSRDYDVGHFHNMMVEPADGTKSCIQFHSEPHRCQTGAEVNKKLVIAQYHATLDEYRDCKPVRNIIDYNRGFYEYNRVDDKIRVAFSPSARTNNGYWYNKGYIQTKRVLERLKTEFPKKFDYSIITGVPLKDCIREKRKANIIIDECVTPSYHRSGLEGLALGKMTICSVHPEVEKVFLSVAGSDTNPFQNVQIQHLYHKLKEYINLGVGYVNQEGKRSYDWMRTHWNPKDIVNDFISIYENL